MRDIGIVVSSSHGPIAYNYWIGVRAMLRITLREGPGELPLHRQIADQIHFQIEQGDIVDGTLLPSTRNLARELGIARGTVVLAYEELCAAGTCESRVGRGTSANGPKRPAKTSRDANRPRRSRKLLLEIPNEPVDIDPGAVSLLPSIADTGHLPITALRRGFDKVLRRPTHLKEFTESAGDPLLRRLICQRILPQRGIDADPSEVLVVPGTQYGSLLLAMTLAESRKTFHFGEPGYLDFARNFARFGFSLRSHPVDASGVAAPISSLGEQDVLYVMPEHHFPQCVSLSGTRRRTIIRAVEQDGLLVIEDDYDSEFYYNRRPQPALKSNDESGGVVYLGTFSKSLFNSLRLGYIVASPELISELATLHWSLSRGTSGILQRWVAELISEGTIESHVQRMRTVYRRRRDKIATLLEREFPEWRITIPQGGLQFFIETGNSKEANEVIEACRLHRLRVALPSSYVMPGSTRQNFFVLGFGSAPFQEIERALLKVKQALSGA